MKPLLVVDGLEVQFKRFTPLRNRAVTLIFELQPDDAKADLIEALRDRFNHRFMIDLKQIPDDEIILSAEEVKGSSDSTVGATPASGGDIPARAKSLGNVGYGHASRGDFQGFLFEVSHIILQNLDGVGAPPVNPMDRKNLAATLIRAFCKVESMADIKPGTPAAERFRWLEAAFAADQQGLDPSEILEPVHK